MAIIIPSAKTYDRNNPKVRDNVIERIEIMDRDIFPNISKNNVSVYNGKFETEIETQKEPEVADKFSHTINPNEDYRHFFYIRVETQSFYYNIDKIRIPILKNNEYVKELILGKNDIGEANISVSLKGYLEKGDAFGYLYLTQDLARQDFEGIIYKDYKERTGETFTLKDKEKTIRIDLPEAPIGSTSVSLTAEDTSNLADIKEAEIVTENGVEYFELKNLRVLCGVKKGRVKGDDIYYGGDIEGAYIYCEGDYEHYIPIYCDISIMGNTIGIEINESLSIVEQDKITNKKIFSVDGNELFQTSNYYKRIDPTTSASKILYDNVLKEYKNGKETTTIRCSIADYYENGSKVIAIDNSTDKMCFEIGDEVVPMVYGANGQDRPMSLYQDGSPKVFKVLGTNIYYDGAVWQELSLQEVAQKV